jgi:hypothetical protein
MNESADGSLTPVRFRERVRLGGPSILGDVPGYVDAVPAKSQARAEPVAGQPVHAEAA